MASIEELRVTLMQVLHTYLKAPQRFKVVDGKLTITPEYIKYSKRIHDSARAEVQQKVPPTLLYQALETLLQAEIDATEGKGDWSFADEMSFEVYSLWSERQIMLFSQAS